ncbi:MAG: hypothetical protein ACRDQX_10980 [Pseudonocardiaceae bacterium]
MRLTHAGRQARVREHADQVSDGPLVTVITDQGMQNRPLVTVNADEGMQNGPPSGCVTGKGRDEDDEPVGHWVNTSGDQGVMDRVGQF